MARSGSAVSAPESPTGTRSGAEAPQAPFVRDALWEWSGRGGEVFHTDVSGESRTKQEFREECDINTIVRRFTETGEWPEAQLPPQFADVTGVDFREMMDMVNEANASFERLPAHVRRRFGHSPEQFVEFCSDPRNREEMHKLGLVERQEDAEARNAPGKGRRSTEAQKAPVGGSGASGANK